LENNKKFIKEWEAKRKKGKFKYILTRTIIKIVITILCIVAIAVLGVGFVSIYTGVNTFHILNIQLLKKALHINKVSIPLLILIISSFSDWISNERKYNELLNNK